MPRAVTLPPDDLKINFAAIIKARDEPFFRSDNQPLTTAGELRNLAIRFVAAAYSLNVL